MRRPSLALAAAVLLTAVVSRAWAVTDPLREQQYALDRVQAEAALTKGRGAGVVVAVIDTGVDLVHEDLVAKLLPGRDFVDGDDRPQDVNGHGTHIAGIVAATTGNGAGISGVAPDARLLPLRALDEQGTGIDTDVADAIDHAVTVARREGLRLVVNLALTDLDVRAPEPSDHIERAVRDAWRAGAVIVAAAGNDASAIVDQTAAGPNILSVGAVDAGDRRLSFSNRRPIVVAPGHRIVSTFWDPAAPDDHAVYALGSGTSMAASVVSGVAALLLSSGATNAEAVRRIIETAEDLGPRGRDDEFGFGRVNAARAMGVGVATVEPSGGAARSAVERFEKLAPPVPRRGEPAAEDRGPVASAAIVCATLALLGVVLRARAVRA